MIIIIVLNQGLTVSTNTSTMKQAYNRIDARTMRKDILNRRQHQTEDNAISSNRENPSVCNDCQTRTLYVRSQWLLTQDWTATP